MYFTAALLLYLLAAPLELSLLVLYALLPLIPAAHGHCARTCRQRSLCWWLGFLCFETRGCVVAFALMVYFAGTGTALLQIFGPTFVVYFLRGWTSSERGAKHPGSLREYIGVTEKHVDERRQEHMGRARNKGAVWLKFVEIEGNPIVLYQTDNEAEALEVEMFAVLWRYQRKIRERRYGIFPNGAGGTVRGAWFLRHHLQQPEMNFIALALGKVDGVEALPVLTGLRDDEWPTPHCITGEAVGEARLWFLLPPVKRHHPADMRRHMNMECFKCRTGGHLSRYCPEFFATPEKGRYVEPAVAAAVAPARPRRAAPGTGEQKDYHKNPTFDGPRCGKQDAKHPGPCDFGAEDEHETCQNCGRKRQCAAGNGGGKRRKLRKPKCGAYPNCGPARADGTCEHCERMVKKPRNTWARN